MDTDSVEEEKEGAEGTERQSINNKIHHGKSCYIPALSVCCGAGRGTRRGGYVPVHKVSLNLVYWDSDSYLQLKRKIIYFPFTSLLLLIIQIVYLKKKKKL